MDRPVCHFTDEETSRPRDKTNMWKVASEVVEREFTLEPLISSSGPLSLSITDG